MKKLACLFLFLSLLCASGQAIRIFDRFDKLKDAPSQTGNSGKVLSTDGAGVLSWVSQGAGTLPDQTGNSGKYLTTNGTDASWGTISLSGYVPTTTTVNGHALSSNVTVTASDLSLVVGTNVQAYDADLTTYAGITPSANVQSLLGAADYSAMRTLFGLVIGTNVQAWDTDLDTWATVTPTTVGQNIAKLTNPSAISFVKIAADNTVSTRTPAQVLSDIGAQGAGTIIGSVGFTTDGAGGTITTGVKGYVVIPANMNCTITGWSIVADGSSPTCTVDVWKISTGTVLPTVSNTIMGTKPALSTGNVKQSPTMTGWTTATITAGDIIGFNVDAVTVATKLTFQLEIVK